MKVAVLGATGPTGQLVVNEALKQGHDVVAVVRNPDKLVTDHEKLKVVKADLTDNTQLTKNFCGCNAVLSAIGGKGGVLTPCNTYTSIGKAAISAMRESGVKRFICCTSWGTKDDPNLPFVWRWVLRPGFLRNLVKNMEEFEDYLTSECSDINYTVVRPPRLMNTPCSTKPLQVEEGVLVKGCDVNEISRHDVAKFMVSCLSKKDYDNKLIAINAQKQD